MSEMQTATQEELHQTIRRYERAIRAIAACPLTGADFGDYVQAVCEGVLIGAEAECWNCGTIVHEGPCVGDGETDPAVQSLETQQEPNTGAQGGPSL